MRHKNFDERKLENLDNKNQNNINYVDPLRQAEGNGVDKNKLAPLYL